MASALSGSDPVVFFESQRLYDTVELFKWDGVPRDFYRIPIGEPDIKRPGKDLTIVTIGATLYRAIEAADRLSAEFGIEAEVIDARSLVPFDYEPLLASIRRTGRTLLTSDACERGSYLATLAANIQELAFDYLDAPVTIVGAPNWIAPPAEMEKEYWPQPEWLLDAVHTRLLPLTGYIAHRPESRERRIDAARRGV
jgi:2-oxoisovalerate dehydrogenase E1 component